MATLNAIPIDVSKGPEKGAALVPAPTIEVPPPLQPPSSSTDSIPDGGYGWICVLGVFILNGFTWGVAASYGVYLSHYLSSHTFPSASPLDYALIGGLEFAIAMLLAPLVTIITKALGLRRTLSLGVLAQSLGFVLASFAADRVWVLYLTQGALVGVGIGFLFTPSVAVLPQWFWARRTLAQGISSAGSGLGGIVFSLGTDAMIRNISLEWALRITGIVTFVANAVAAVLLRDRNEAVRPSQIGFATYLFKSVDVCLFLAYSFVNLFGYMTVLYSLSNYATSIGLGQKQASTVTAILNLGTFVGRPAIGFASDRLGRLPVAAFAALINGLSCFVIWLPCDSYGVLIFYSLFVGAIIGTFWMTAGPLAAEVAGLKEVPSLLSLTWLSIVLPTAFAEVIALYLRRPDSGRPYLYPQIFAGMAYIVSSLFLFAIWRRKRKSTAKV
ncbi:hypothetical protein MBLNU457_7504t1 [Dothideomycetes sp. NU457]